MQLTLKVLSYCDQNVSESHTRTFDTFPIVIGRSNTCDYYLDDPSQYVSSNHAVILIEDDQLLIRDTSSNGVYINGITEPIGRQRTVILNDNDTLAIGDYSLSVAIKKRHPDVDLGNLDVHAPKPSTITPQEKPPDMVSTLLAVKQQNVPADNYPSALDNSNDQLGTLLRAASLEYSDFSHLNDSVVLEHSGRMLAQMVDAMMFLLSSRAEIKEYLQSDNTRLSGTNNNPLKFSASSTDALGTLLSNGKSGYLPSEEAIQEAVDDLQLHQLALLEGMKLAIKSLLLKFEPNELAKNLGNNASLENNIPVTRKAKLWESFCEQYDEIREEATNDFQALLGAEFRKFYEQQARIKARNKAKSTTKNKKQYSKMQEPDF